MNEEDSQRILAKCLMGKHRQNCVVGFVVVCSWVSVDWISQIRVWYQCCWNRIRDVFFHSIGGMDFPDIVNMFVDDCLSCFNMQ